MDVFNGNTRDLADFGQVRKLVKTTPVHGVELTVTVEVKTAEGLTYQGNPGDWLLEAEDGRRWTCDAGYVEANYALVDGLPPIISDDLEGPDAGVTADLPTPDDTQPPAADAADVPVTSSTLTAGAQA